MSNFHVGQKVECIGYPPVHPIRPGECLPQKGTVYTVRAAKIQDGWPSILLDELRNPEVMTMHGMMERWCVSQYFRPVIERTTDISIFRKLLQPTLSKEPV